MKRLLSHKNYRSGKIMQTWTWSIMSISFGRLQLTPKTLYITVPKTTRRCTATSIQTFVSCSQFGSIQPLKVLGKVSANIMAWVKIDMLLMWVLLWMYLHLCNIHDVTLVSWNILLFSLTLAFTLDKDSSLLGESPVLVWPNNPSQTSSLCTLVTLYTTSPGILFC